MNNITADETEDRPSLDIPLLAFWSVYIIGVLSGAAVALAVMFG